MIEVGRLVVKLAGRDAGLKGIVIDIVDDNFVLIDGQVRRKKVNVKHIEPLDQIIKIKKGASHADVVSELKKLKIDVKETKPKEKTVRPRKVRKKKEKPVEEKDKKETKVKKEKKAEEKVEKKEEVKKGEEKKE